MEPPMISKNIKDSALKLSELDKIRLIELLCDSLERPNPEVEQLWAKESEARYKAYKSGQIKGVSFSSLIKKYGS